MLLRLVLVLHCLCSGGEIIHLGKVCVNRLELAGGKGGVDSSYSFVHGTAVCALLSVLGVVFFSTQ